jgi:enoyl-[acyl-carrier protein] reductase I
MYEFPAPADTLPPASEYLFHWTCIPAACTFAFMDLMKGKRGVIFGVANDKSLAWGIAQRLRAEGAELAFTYLNEVFEKRVRPLAESLGAEIVMGCDVSRDSDVEGVFTEIEQRWGSLDFIVHSVAYAGREDLRKPFHQTTREGFRIALDISAYSLVAISRAALPLMKAGGAILTMTYLGSQRAVPNYNVMGVAKAALEAVVRYLAAELGEGGIRVNAISAGPVRTLAATGISNFSEIFGIMEARSPMHRSVTQEEVGKSALYLLSELSTGVTGDIHYVDTGYNIVGL